MLLEVEEAVVVLVNDPVDVADLLLEVVCRVRRVSGLLESRRCSVRFVATLIIQADIIIHKLRHDPFG